MAEKWLVGGDSEVLQRLGLPSIPHGLRPCSICSRLVTIDNATLEAASKNPEWRIVCLRCVCQAKGIPLPPELA